MLRYLPLFLLLPACSGEPQAPAENTAAAPEAPAATATANMSAPAATEAALVDIPKDEAARTRMLATGYTIHDDHMHKPGVSACPKMSDDMVQ